MRTTLFGSATALCCVLLSGPVAAEPLPGDVFREYRWTNVKGDAGGALRVGGKHGESHPDRGSDHGYINAAIEMPQAFDLEHSVKAEVVIEKLLCHDGTRGLAVEVNGNAWIAVPESAGVPAPQWDYQHHVYPVVPAPLDQLKAGKGNRFRLRVSPEHPWRWPQHLIYGVHFRVYYDPAKKPHPAGEMAAPRSGEALGRQVELRVKAVPGGEPIARVDYLGLYDDVNWEGDGRYRQWHYHYVRGELRHHLGTSAAPPYSATWDTSWVPDQSVPMQVAAWIADGTGLTYFTRPAENLTFHRPGLSVELCRPYDVPKRWVTRAGVKEQAFDIRGDPAKAVAAQLAWTSWSPGYMNGILINGRKVVDGEGPRYQYFAHRVGLSDLGCLKPGKNVLQTGATPKHDGKTVHGMEVNWPGIMVLIQYRTD